ncbi:MAG TPA: glycosyltransferase family 39 protein [Candidatus Tectomicrobia bacterium]
MRPFRALRTLHPTSPNLPTPFDQRVPWQRYEAWILVGLFVLTLATRWPLRVSSLEEYDSANYALALEEFNLVIHQPHPPGYIFFIWVSRFAQLWTDDAVQALTAVQVVSGALSIALFYVLLRLCMRPLWAFLSTLMLTFSAQVWFQQVRPLEDAFAWLWMLGVVYALVRSLTDGGRWWIGGMSLLGLAMGVKQVLPSFLLGLLARTLWEYGRQRRFQTVMLGVFAAAIASLTWVVPLSLHAGSVQSYLALALTQLQWQRQHDALIFNWVPSHIRSQWAATFLIIWGGKSLALPMWGLAATGAWQVWRHYPALRWLLWLVVPILGVRFFTLGYWPRFTLYYLPFLIPLVVVGLYTLLLAASRVIHRLGLSTHLTWPHLQARWAIIVAVIGVILWTAFQVRYIFPTLYILHWEPTPVRRAMQFIQQHYDPARTGILSDSQLISRHLDYYAKAAGFINIYEPRIRHGVLQGVDHVLRMQEEPIPPSLGQHLGTWSFKVPRWRELSQQSDFLHVSLYEHTGPIVIFRDWHRPEVDGERLARWSKPEGSQIWIFRGPPEEFAIRLRGEVRTLPGHSSAPGLMIEVDGAYAYRLDGPEIDTLVHIPAAATIRNPTMITVRPPCGFVPALVARSSDLRHLGCFRLTDVAIQP